MELEGRIALVTGAGSGIGRAAALRLAREGARVGLLGRGQDALERVEAEIAATGGEATALSADVSAPEAV